MGWRAKVVGTFLKLVLERIVNPALREILLQTSHEINNVKIKLEIKELKNASTPDEFNDAFDNLS
jgi:hypothetical protein